MKVLESPFKIPFFLLSRFICIVRSAYYTRKINDGGGRITITDPFIKFKILKNKTAHLFIKGELEINSFIGGDSSTVISIGENSILQINGDFTIGHGVKISLSKNASLIIGGKDKESGSGITCDTLILVYKRIEIGTDFLCAWNTFITDSDWHQIEDQDHQADVFIGNHVWVANSNSILKGSKIGNNCIVASNSKIANTSFPDDVLIGGAPSKILKSNINWRRDIS